MKPRSFALMLGAGTLVAAGIPLHAAAQASDRYVSPFGVDSGDCSDAINPCATVSYALTQADQSGDTVHLARGAYQEQLLITKSVAIVGAGQDHTSILARTTLAFDSRPEPQTYIVAITNDGVDPAPAVTMSALSVAGPGPPGGGSDCSSNPSSLDKGIEVYGGAGLTLSQAAVRNVYDRPLSGCRRGDAISVGTACDSCTPDTGSAVLSKVVVSAYQEDGVVVRGAGSSLKMKATQVLDGALAQITGGVVSGNECNLASTCGPDPVNQTQAAGILISEGAASGSFVKKTNVIGNDLGIHTDSPFSFTGVHADSNRYIGVFVGASAADAVFSSVTANSGGTDSMTGAAYGFYVLSPSSNAFSGDIATGNTNTEGGTVTPYDMFTQVTGHDNNIYSANTCTTAFPTPHYWNCA